MGEIDTKPIEPVQVALTFFGQKSDHQRRNRPTANEVEKDEELENLLKELANFKLQMEAKESSYSQLLLKLDHSHKLSEQLNAQLQNSEAEKHVYAQQCADSKLRIDELESKLKEMANQLMETGKLKEQLWHVRTELKDAQMELLSMETELADSNETKLKALTRADLMEAAANMEKERSEELQEAVYEAKRVAAEAEKDKENAVRAQEEAEKMKTVLTDSLQDELNDAMNDSKKLREKLQEKESEISDKAFYIEKLEPELNLIELELKNSYDMINNLKSEIVALTDELQKEKTEMGAIKAVENEAEEAKKENERLKRGLDKPETDDSGLIDHTKYIESSSHDCRRDENGSKILISAEEYESLIRKATTNNDQSPAEDRNLSGERGGRYEVEALKKELEAATAKIADLRTRAEQAATRAEAAERAKTRVEDQINMWREHKQKRKAALAALKEVSSSGVFSAPIHEITHHKAYQPLGNILNMKF